MLCIKVRLAIWRLLTFSTASQLSPMKFNITVALSNVLANSPLALTKAD